MKTRVETYDVGLLVEVADLTVVGQLAEKPRNSQSSRESSNKIPPEEGRLDSTNDSLEIALVECIVWMK